VPVSIANFDIVILAVVSFEDIQFRNVENNAFTMRGRDAPLAPFTVFGHSAGRENRRGERSFVFLECTSALCQKTGN
jgi:hypothetical protein